MKYTKVISLSVLAGSLALTACTNTVSRNITAEGRVNASDLVFPNVQKAWQKDGIFPNTENLEKIKAGITKDDLYHLIGRPHFSERQNAHEWDYIFKFYQEDNSVKVCQYKVIFDKNYQGQEFYWQPADCGKYAQRATAEPVFIHAPAVNPVISTPEPINSAPVALVNEKINLSADALFAFNKWQLKDMRSAGKQELDDLAEKLLNYQKEGDVQAIITGHTDYLGDDMYNLNLSQLRAQTVRQYLISKGVDASLMIASGAGEGSPVQQCATNLSHQALIDCLQPNRRVEVVVTVRKSISQ